MRAIRHFDGFRGVDGRAWLLSIVRNTCFTQLRRRTLSEKVEFDEEIHSPQDEGSEPEANLASATTAESVREGLDRLAVEYREVLVLRELEGLSYKGNRPRGRGADRHRDVALGARAQAVAARPRGRPRRRMTEMECRDVIDRLSSFVDDELDAVASREVSRHLESCANCTAALDRQRQTQRKPEPQPRVSPRTGPVASTGGARRTCGSGTRGRALTPRDSAVALAEARRPRSSRWWAAPGWSPSCPVSAETMRPRARRCRATSDR